MGFDWPNMEGLFDKLKEETSELREHLQEFPAPGPRPEGRGIAGSGRPKLAEDLLSRLEEEVGDLFFVLVNIARYLSVDPESALRKTNRKFRRRFQWMEARLYEAGLWMGLPWRNLNPSGSKLSGTRGRREAESIVIRKCEGLDELRACIALQKEIWNFSDAELVPLRMFVVAEKVGGQVMGAFDGSEMVGFALSVPGTRSGHVYLHSHMLAVRKDHRNSGLGRRLKLLQREDALARDIELIEWTFDPLEIKNAYLNIEKLGAIARRYNINQYGITSSPLQGGLPSDRLIAEWWLKSRRVENLLTDGKNSPSKPAVAIEVPAQIYEWKAAIDTRGKAQQVQERNRQLFLDAFNRGLAVLGYERDSEGNGKFLLGKWDEEWSYASK